MLHPTTSSQHLLFVVIGIGTGWYLHSALTMQIPFWQREFPSVGLCLSLYVNIIGHAAVVAILPLLWLRWACPQCATHRAVVAFLFSIQLLSLFELAAFWSLGEKIILATSFISGMIGSLFGVVFVPWLNSHGAENIPYALFGQRCGQLIESGLGLLQQPGSEDVRFDPTVSLLALSLPLCVSIGAAIHAELKAGSNHHLPKSLQTPLTSSFAAASAPTTSGATAYDLFRDERLLSTIPLMLSIGWIDANTFGLHNAILPFAAANTDPRPGGLGSVALQNCILAGFVGLPVGSFTALALPKWRNVYALTFIFTLFSALLVLASADGFPTFWRTKIGVATLIGCAGLVRFLEAYTTTIVYVVIAERHGAEHAPRLSFWTGVCDRAMVTIGTGLGVVAVKWLQADGVADDRTQC